MSESNNVKFVEADGKWCWKRYDENGSVIFKSPLFDTEREAREDYDATNGNGTASSSESAAPADVPTAEATPEQGPQGSAEGTADSTAGSATGDGEQQQDNSAGSATI